MLRVLDFAAPGASQVASEKGLEHQHELLLASKIKVRSSPGQAGGVGDIRPSTVVQTFPGERRHGGVHQLRLHSAIITFFRHQSILANAECNCEPWMEHMRWAISAGRPFFPRACGFTKKNTFVNKVEGMGVTSRNQ